jgi:hypothetical protein
MIQSMIEFSIEPIHLDASWHKSTAPFVDVSLFVCSFDRRKHTSNKEGFSFEFENEFDEAEHEAITTTPLTIR